MKYALVNDVKREAAKGVKGVCPVCGSELIAKLGEVKIHHWSHKGNRKCDHWWENETKWHRMWKSHFPIEWQEVVHHDENKEKHIADVKTNEDFIVEFQHSPIKPNERRSRNEFFKKIIWVVDGLRRERDKIKLKKVLEEGATILTDNFSFEFTEFPEESRILREWANSGVPVFFDFNESSLLFLLPIKTTEIAYLVTIDRSLFIEFLINSEFADLLKVIYSEFKEYQKRSKLERQQSIKRQQQDAMRNHMSYIRREQAKRKRWR